MRKRFIVLSIVAVLVPAIALGATQASAQTSGKSNFDVTYGGEWGQPQVKPANSASKFKANAGGPEPTGDPSDVCQTQPEMLVDQPNKLALHFTEQGGIEPENGANLSPEAADNYASFAYATSGRIFPIAKANSKVSYTFKGVPSSGDGVTSRLTTVMVCIQTWAVYDHRGGFVSAQWVTKKIPKNGSLTVNQPTWRHDDNTVKSIAAMVAVWTVDSVDSPSAANNSASMATMRRS